MPGPTAKSSDIYKRYSMYGKYFDIPLGIEDDWKFRKRRENAEVAPRGRASLDREFINRLVKWELKYIPKGEKGSLQNSLRFSYKILRRKHLTMRKSRHETLKELVEKMHRVHPNFTPLYDKEIFKI